MALQLYKFHSNELSTIPLLSTEQLPSALPYLSPRQKYYVTTQNNFFLFSRFTIVQ
jgi:hypothetical protein